MEQKTKSLKFFLQSFLILGLHNFTGAQHEDMRSSCRTAPSDLVFILDGSWSVGDTNFEIIKRWLVNITSNFDIGQTFTQVGVVQYSDNPLLEIPLGKYVSSEKLIEAMESIQYMGGNTQTGIAIKFAWENMFAHSARAANGVTKIAVVLTDGKSQDEVRHAAEEARKNRITLFAIGIGSETEEAELKAIANKPSSTYVFYVDDYLVISKIREMMSQKLCEETVCPTRIPVAARDEKGFDILLGVDIAKKAKRTQGSYSGSKAYLVTSQVDLTESTSNIFPDGLPPSYVFVTTMRFKEPVTREKWDLWRIQALDGTSQIAVTLNGQDKTVTFTTTSMGNGTQQVTFTSAGLKKLFDENWHQLRVLVTQEEATLYVDDQQVEIVKLDPVLGIYISGKTQIGKYFGKEETVPFELQKLRIYCDPEQNNRETACEIPGINGECLNVPGDTETTPAPCTCPPGPPGLPGLKGECGQPGEPGDPGRPGTDGKPGIPGFPGNPGLQGSPGIQGPRGMMGYKGEPGGPGDSGERGFPGLPGTPAPQGEKGSQGPRGEHGLPGIDGKIGEKGDKGSAGLPGPSGPRGTNGRNGQDGMPGIDGQKGETGQPGIPGRDGIQGYRGIPGSPGNEGPMGVKGDTGLQGERGPKGSTGISGEMGLPGLPGSSGIPGVKGIKGGTGLPGMPGLQGIEGRPGEPGMAGQQGHPGLPGIKGHKGDKGNQGETGIQGIVGGKGEPGRPGNQGVAGPSGLKGVKGEHGEPGIRGQDGHRGEHGQPGMVGPRGPRGLNGATGPSGSPGIEGRPGRELSEEFIRQICLDVLRTQLPSFLHNGRTRSCDVCQTLKGSPGSPGPIGPQGSRGFSGLPGSNGLPGRRGSPGLPGIPGIKGYAGEIGPKGNQGIGKPGDPGNPGLPGPVGPPGISKEGYPGKPGPRGHNGDQGKPGIPGAPGEPGICDPSLCYRVMVGRDPFRKGPNY
ncbi:collagen alpha-1(XXI) chain-like [Polyodon spathula]|uniref:collagen alpha-1(XXI) chain-like n=1 Tax=Polyodon spathula TaxID=7913 RepID=UPI001B7DA3CD|nr:collagen alpha-1(XXI) chain-like [Polyodon spathula]